MKKYILVLLLIVFIIPSVAFASWWNPFSWKIFSFLHKKEVPVQTQVIEEKTPDEKINELQKQVEELKKQQAESTSKPKSVPVIKPAPKSVLIPTPVATTSTLEERNEAYVLFDKIIKDSIDDVKEIQATGKKIMEYPSTYESEIKTALARLDSLIEDTNNFVEEIYGYAEEINRTKYVDINYWKNTGVPNLVAEQKKLLERRLNIMNDFNNDIKDARSSTQTYQNNYQSACAEIEEQIRTDIQSSGGMATESQIQALLANEGC
jgi:DNA repair ATPase RecN